MPTLLGADTLVPVTQNLVNLMRNRYGGATPLFWGRYFKKPDFAEDFQPESERAVFRENNIQLLPIARQTARVAGTATEGAEDAILNVDAYVQSLGNDHLASIGGEMIMFLDVEGTSDANPNLSLDYWIGWSSALVNYSHKRSGRRYTIVPGVYCRQNQPTTWQAIARADQLGHPCAGAWVFRMRSGACTAPIGTWDPTFLMPKVALPCPVMIWQFAIDCLFEGGVDFDMLNPDAAVNNALRNRLVVP